MDLDLLHVANQLNIKQLHSTGCATLCELFKKCTSREKLAEIFGDFLDEPLNDESWKKTTEKFTWLSKKKKPPVALSSEAGTPHDGSGASAPGLSSS